MRELQSFDAFYARTVQSVTSKMHALAGDDPQADHAVREAYARAYQQWFEVSGYRDAEDWVLDAATEAYERRRANSGPGGRAPLAPDTGTWPGMYREPAPPRSPAADPAATGPIDLGPGGPGPGGPGPAGPGMAGAGAGSAGAAAAATFETDFGQPPAADGGWFQPAAALGSPLQSAQGQGDPLPWAAGQAEPPPAGAPWGSPFPSAAGQAEPPPAGAPWGSPFPSAADQAEPPPAGAPWGSPFPSGAAQTGPVLAAAARADRPQQSPLQPGSGLAGPFDAGPAGAGAPATTPGRPSATGSLTDLLNRPQAGTMLIAVLAVVALVAASAAAYLAFGRKTTAGHRATPPATVKAKPRPQMLADGRVGPRSAVPWSLVGPGWVLAEVTTAVPDADGQAAGPGTVTTYLVDPRGGRYLVRQWSGTQTATLIAWSGNAVTALYSDLTPGSSTLGYSLLNLATGQITQLVLPAAVSVAGFTRPDGLNLVAVQQGPLRYKLQRYSLTGTLTAELSYLPVRPGQPSWVGCGIGCGALSSPDGITAVWGVTGDEMQLVGNRGGIIRRLHVPDSGTPPSCSPISWWGPGVILASCAAPAPTGTVPTGLARRLWLVPADGAAPTALTLASGSPSGAGFYTGAWQAGGTVYVTATSSTQCPQAASGPGGMDILRLGAGGTATAIPVPGTTGYHNSIVGSAGGRLFVLAQTSCPGTSSLLSFDPADSASQTLLTAPSTEAGVISAMAFGTQ